MPYMNLLKCVQERFCELILIAKRGKMARERERATIPTVLTPNENWESNGRIEMDYYCT